MLTKKETHFLHGLLAAWIALGILALVSIILSIIDIWQAQSMNDNIIELLFMGIHLVVIGFFIMVTISAFKKGSYIIRGLTYSAHEGVSIPIRVASILIFSLGTFLFIYGLLILAPSGVYDFSFPITLKWAILNSGLLLMVLMTAFFAFPFLFANNPTLTKKEEIERKERNKQKR